MLLLPYSTDAPIYHWPIATVSLIVINTAVFLATVLQAMIGNVDFEAIEWLLLDYSMINPLQWFTSPFMHGDPMHLIGNLFFLWCFGLIVEGKIGSLIFLAIYMAIAVIQSAIEQSLMFICLGEGASLGASSAIFGIMVIALLWAPENDVECFYWVFAAAGTFEIRIVKIAGLFLFLQIVEMYFSGFRPSSGLLHVMGAMVGAPIGLWFLREQKVDCEDWDIISRNDWLQTYPLLCSDKQREHLRSKDREQHDPVAAALAQPYSAVVRRTTNPPAPTSNVAPSTREKKKTSRFLTRAAAAPPSPSASDHPDFNRLSLLLRQSLAAGSLMMAQQHFGKLDQLGLAHGLADKTLYHYVKSLIGAKQYVLALRPLHVIATHGGPMATDAWLRIAQIQLRVQRNPAAAAQTLEQIRFADASLTDAQLRLRQQRDQLLAQCAS